jgi:hypothetical protein
LLGCLYSPTSIPARRSFSLSFFFFFLAKNRQNATHFSENEMLYHKFLNFIFFNSKRRCHIYLCLLHTILRVPWNNVTN